MPYSSTVSTLNLDDQHDLPSLLPLSYCFGYFTVSIVSSYSDCPSVDLSSSSLTMYKVEAMVAELMVMDAITMVEFAVLKVVELLLRLSMSDHLQYQVKDYFHRGK